MSNTLREEYKKHKTHQADVIDEAAVEWAKQNIVLISEKMNRMSINRLTNSITRFDEKFGKFSEKLPALQDVLDKAETGLQLVLTGKTSESRASDMLRHLSLVYNLLSEFFAGDLPTLLKTHLFRSARENPDVRLDSITGAGYNPKDIVLAFVNALRPSKDEIKLLGKVYKNVPLPNLRAEETAKQLLGMSYNELMELTSVGKVPMVTTPDQVADQVVPEEKVAPPPTVAPSAPVVRASPRVNETPMSALTGQTPLPKA